MVYLRLEKQTKTVEQQILKMICVLDYLICYKNRNESYKNS